MITSIKLKVSDVEIELSVEEAKKLQRELNDVFGDKTVVERHYERWPYWWTPIYQDQITCNEPYITYGPNTGDPIQQQPYTICITGNVCA